MQCISHVRLREGYDSYYIHCIYFKMAVREREGVMWRFYSRNGGHGNSELCKTK